MHRGLWELYDRFGTKEFTGSKLRDVMVSVVDGGNKAGWQASLALGRLVKAGVVCRVETGVDARAAWGHTYEISSKGLAWLGVVDEPTEVDEEFERLKRFVMALSDKRRRVSPKFINHEDNRETLRLGVALGWLQLVVSVTAEGAQRVGESSGN